MKSKIQADVMVRIDLATLPRVLTIPQLAALMNGIAQVIAAQK